MEQLMVAAAWCREEDWDVVVQHLFADRSYEEIAAEQGVTCAAVRKRLSRAIHHLGEASRLQALMTRHGLPTLQQEVIGIHRCRKAGAATIADLLQLPERRVALWIDEARPLLRELDEGRS